MVALISDGGVLVGIKTGAALLACGGKGGAAAGVGGGKTQPANKSPVTGQVHHRGWNNFDIE